MKPWQVCADITISVLGVTVILVGEELHYLPTHLLLEHWEPIALRAGLAAASLAAGVYAAARALGLTGHGTADRSRRTRDPARSRRRGTRPSAPARSRGEVQVIWKPPHSPTVPRWTGW